MEKKQLTKKQIIIFVIVILVGVPAFLFFTNYKKPTPSPEFKSDYERSKYINDFTNKEKGVDPNKDISSNESGYTGIFVQNKQALLSGMNADGMISVNDMLNEAFKYIPKFYEDSKNLKDSNISQYYNKNIDTINYTFGIKDLDTFKIFLNDLSFIGDKGKLSEATIEDNSVIKSGDLNNEITFNLILKSTNGKSHTFKIKSIIQENNQKNNKLIYWY